jgi:hypothetical protein
MVLPKPKGPNLRFRLRHGDDLIIVVVHLPPWVLGFVQLDRRSTAVQQHD